MNNPQTPSGDWRAKKVKMKLMFPELVDADFRYDYGMKEVMLNHLQEKLGKSRSELNELISDCTTKKSQLKYYGKAKAFLK